MLGEILDSEAALEILEHTPDMAGQTNLVFALFDLLGLEFTPRLRDITDPEAEQGQGLRRDLSGPQVYRPGQLRYLARQWEKLPRVVGSLELGYVTASLFIRQPQAYPRQHQQAYGLLEYGRLVKTIFILRYLAPAPAPQAGRGPVGGRELSKIAY